MAGPDSTPCTAQASTAFGASFLEPVRRLLDRARGVDDVVLEDARASLDIADHVHHLGGPFLVPPLVHDRQLSIQTLGIGTSAFRAAGVR